MRGRRHEVACHFRDRDRRLLRDRQSRRGHLAILLLRGWIMTDIQNQYSPVTRLVCNVAITLLLAAGMIAFVLWALGYHIVWAPTEDQLYGCTVAQQAPNGECQ